MWRIRALTREALTNVVADRWRTTVLAAISALLIGGLALSDYRTTGSLWTETQRRNHEGISVVIASSDTGLPAATCHALNARPDVRSAGGFRSRGIATLATAPSIRFPAADITAGMLAIWDPTLTHTRTPPATAVGESLRDELAVVPGSFLRLTGGQVLSVDAVYAATNRSELQARWLVTLAAPVGRVDECWVEFTPGAQTAGRDIVTAAFTTQSNELNVRSLIDLGTHARSLADDFADRPSRSLLPIAVIVTTLLACLMTWFRRSELALYRALGTTRLQLLWLAQVENLAVLTIGATVGGLWATFITHWQRATTTDPIPLLTGASVATRTVAVTGLVLVCIAPVITLVVRGDIARDLKDR